MERAISVKLLQVPPPAGLPPFPLCLPELAKDLPGLWGELHLRPPVQSLQVLQADRPVSLPVQKSCREQGQKIDLNSKNYP